MTSTSAGRPGPDEALAGVTARLRLDTSAVLARLAPELGNRLWPGHPDHPLVSRLTEDLVGAGLPISHGNGRRRTSGVRLVTSDLSPGSVRVSWRTHEAMVLDPARNTARRDTELLLALLLDDLLHAYGWRTAPRDDEGSRVVLARGDGEIAAGGGSSTPASGRSTDRTVG